MIELQCGCAPRIVHLPGETKKSKLKLIFHQDNPRAPKTSKTMTAKQAISFCRKLLKWHRGEIDEWDKKNRVPPPKEITRFYKSCLIGMDYLAKHEIDIQCEVKD